MKINILPAQLRNTVFVIMGLYACIYVAENNRRDSLHFKAYEIEYFGCVFVLLQFFITLSGIQAIFFSNAINVKQCFGSHFTISRRRGI